MGELAARINATTLALIDSGVQLKGMLIAVSVAFVEGEEQGMELRLDPTVFEEEVAESLHLFTVSYGEGVGGVQGEVVGIESRGRFNQDQVSFSRPVFSLYPCGNRNFGLIPRFCVISFIAVRSDV